MTEAVDEVVGEAVMVACCQIAPSVQGVESNLELTRLAVREAAAAGAQLIVLPELALSGYVFESVEEARRAAGVSQEGLAGWAAEAADAGAAGAGAGGRRDVVVVGGFCEASEDGRLYNSCALVDSSGVRAVYRKIHLWDRESLWFSPGDAEAPVVETALGRIGLAVCYDLEFPELARGLALRGADILAVPTNWPRDTVPRSTPILSLLACATAYLSKVFVAVCDRCGVERGLTFEGGSVIAGPDGQVLGGGGSGIGPLTVSANCSPELAQNKRTSSRNDAFADRRPRMYRGLLGQAD